jgi:hypothetical protein
MAGHVLRCWLIGCEPNTSTSTGGTTTEPNTSTNNAGGIWHDLYCMLPFTDCKSNTNTSTNNAGGIFQGAGQRGIKAVTELAMYDKPPKECGNNCTFSNGNWYNGATGELVNSTVR